MSLTSSMWTSVSGLINHGEKMNVIGNNIANINTVGFKGQRMDFQDFVYQDIGSASGTAQVGRGVSIGAIMGDFGQGAFETSTEVTDLAISGKGFFSVVPKGTENAYYTRAGNFRFDKDGYLTEPHGYVLQGWPITNSDSIFGTAAATVAATNAFKGSGVSGDIQLADFSVPPRHTNNVAFQVQLDQRETSKSISNNPASTATVDSNISTTLQSTGTAGSELYTSVNIGGTVYQIGTWSAAIPPVFTPGGVAGPIGTSASAPGTVTIDKNGTPATISLYAPDSAVTVGTGNSTASISGVLTTPTTNSDPFFGLFSNWDGTMTGTNQTPLANGEYAYSTNLKVYDEGGTAHTLTVYFDKVDNTEMNGSTAGDHYWEYIVTIDPANDNRTFESPAGSGTFVPMAGTREAGLLMAGTMTFNSGGQLLDTTAFAPDSTMTVAGMSNLSNWMPAQLSPNGLPLFAANFSGRDNNSFVDLNNAASLSFMTELNLGLSSTSGTWSLPAGVTSAADLGNNAGNLPSMNTTNSPARRSPSASTSFGSASSTILQKQDGYSFGFLSNVSVSAEGVLSGRYSNGIVKELYQLTIYDFVSQQNLRREGGNLFSQTLESGDPAPGIANNNGNGSVNSNSLEQSNVDLSREFTQMITTQRGFQANSKGITTVDTMLEVVINMKR